MMPISRREALKLGIAGAVPLLAGSSPLPIGKADGGPNLWITFSGSDVAKPYMLGAIGMRAICGVQRVLAEIREYTPFDRDIDPLVSVDLDPLVKLGVVIADTQALLREPGWVNDVPDGWGWVLIPARSTTARELLTLRDQVAPTASWVAMGEDPYTGGYLPDPLWPAQSGWSCAPMLCAYLLACPHLFGLLRSHAPGHVIAGAVIRGKAERIIDSGYFSNEQLIVFKEDAPALEGFLIHIGYHGDVPRNQIDRHVDEIRRQSARAILPTIIETTDECSFAPDIPGMLQKLTVWIYDF